MDHSLSSSSIISLKSPGSDSSSVCSNSFKCFSGSGHKVGSSGMENNKAKILVGDNGYVLEDVPHFSDYIPNLPTYPNPLQDNPAYSVVKQYFVNVDILLPKRLLVTRIVQGGSIFGVLDHVKRLLVTRIVQGGSIFGVLDHVKRCILRLRMFMRVL